MYKQKLLVMSKGLEVLEAVDEHYFQASPSAETDVCFDDHMEKLIKYHEHVLLKYDDKLKDTSSDSLEIEAENEQFMVDLLERYREQPGGMLRLSIVAAAMYDYGHQIARLDKLVEHDHRGETEEREPLEILLKSIRLK